MLEMIIRMVTIESATKNEVIAELDKMFQAGEISFFDYFKGIEIAEKIK